jgi:hypothetical protein
MIRTGASALAGYPGLRLKHTTEVRETAFEVFDLQSYLQS